jgi:hypothetical protein
MVQAALRIEAIFKDYVYHAITKRQIQKQGEERKGMIRTKVIHIIDKITTIKRNDTVGIGSLWAPQPVNHDMVFICRFFFLYDYCSIIRGDENQIFCLNIIS